LTDLSKWKKADDKFRQVRFIYHNRKMKKSIRFRSGKHSQQGDSVDPTDNTQTETQIISTQSTTSTPATKQDRFKKDQMSFFTVNDDLEGFDVIHHACDKLIWNALDSDSKIFTLTTYMVFHVRYCAINDIDPEISYRYICQYGE
jgi:hypothetical protein